MQQRVSFLCLICFILVSTSATHAGSAYQHDRFATKPTDIVRQFDACMVSFGSEDYNDGDGKDDTWRVPEFVAYECVGPFPPVHIRYSVRQSPEHL
jgi:hypothetical protein